MASGSGEQGYWPGFVDALSNMVMTLIIIIVLLNIALVFFFYKASKSASRSVQEAIVQTQKSNAEQIDALALENQRLKDELKKALEYTGGPSVRNKEDVSASEAGNASSVLSKDSQVAKTLQEAGSTGTAGGTQKDAAPDAAVVSIGNKARADDQTTQDNLNNAVKNQVQESENASSKDNSVSVDGNLFVIIYKDENVEFSADTLQALDKDVGGLISKDKNIKVDIQVEFLNSSKYSLTRRVAYYRATSIRNYLLGKGADPKKITSHLIEASDSTQYPRALIRLEH